MGTSLGLTSGASDGRGPTAMSIGFLPSFITWLLSCLFLFVPLVVRFLSFSQTSACNNLFYILFYTFASLAIALLLGSRSGHTKREKIKACLGDLSSRKDLFERVNIKE
jgi:hypothetical protein